MGQKVRHILVIVFLLMIMSFIGLYVGHFLFLNHHAGNKAGSTIENALLPVPSPPPYTYKHIETKVNGNEQKINIIEVNLKSGNTLIKPVLSFDSVFGYEKLSAMFERSHAEAAVNAGFFYEYGQPSGMVVIDGRMISNSTGKYPVLLISGGKAVLSEIKTKLQLKLDDRTLDLNGINTPGKPGEMIVYTPEYGTDNRVKSKNRTAVIMDNKIKEVIETDGKTEIPKGGMLVTQLESGKGNNNSFLLNQGGRAEFTYEPFMKKDTQAYECGSWIIRNGKLVAGDFDEWVGVLTNNDPRTAVGIKEDGTVLLMTVDGRQPGFSAGMSAKELGEFLLEYGATDAAMLDGGASTEMIVGGKIVNRPSFKGTERPLGGGLLLN